MRILSDAWRSASLLYVSYPVGAIKGENPRIFFSISVVVMDPYSFGDAVRIGGLA